MEDLITHVLVVVPVDVQLRPIGEPVLVEGNPDSLPIEIRLIVKTALDRDASGIFLAHNHPSGTTTPSHQDRAATKKLGTVLDGIGMRLFDHVVVAGGKWESISQGVYGDVTWQND